MSCGCNCGCNFYQKPCCQKEDKKECVVFKCCKEEEKRPEVCCHKQYQQNFDCGCKNW